MYVIWEESSNDSWQFSASFTSTSQLSLLPFSSTEKNNNSIIRPMMNDRLDSFWVFFLSRLKSELSKNIPEGKKKKSELKLHA